jgi:type I restriction enzyme, R subunit
VEQKSEAELQEAFIRKSAELRRVTRELVDKNPAQYGRFSERVLEVIRRFEEGQIAAADGLRAYEELAAGINAEQGAHAELDMDERAFSILRIMESAAPEIDHATLQAAAIAVGAVYATAQQSQPSWYFMETYKKELRRQVRRILNEHGIPEAKAVRDEIEEFAEQAYAGAH